MSTLVVEDDLMRWEWFRTQTLRYGRYGSTALAMTVPAAIRHLENGEYELIFLDHDLGTEPAVGRDVARWLIEHPDRSPRALIICHSVNAVSGPKIERELIAAGREAKWIPFPLLTRL